MPDHRSRIGHTKSRTGCRTCRARKVKCDEVRPVCGNCSRLDLACMYRPSDVASNSDSSDAQTTASSSRAAPQPASTGIADEGRMQLRLMTFWMSKPSRTGFGDPTNPSPAWRQIWLVDVPELALQYDHVLYALLAMSASQLSAQHPEDAELVAARHHYWNMALSEQRKVLMDNRAQRTEPLLVAAWLITLNSFSMLRGRELAPYHPPLEWIQVAKGTDHIGPPAISVPPGSILRDIVDVTSPIHKEEYEGDLGEPFESILRHPNDVPESDAQSEVYRKACSLVASFRHAIASGQRPYSHVVRLYIFPQRLPQEFVELLQQQRPRALVILAQFFAAVALSRTRQYIGDVRGEIPHQEVQAIANIVPAEWRGYVDHSLSEVYSVGDL